MGLLDKLRTKRDTTRFVHDEAGNVIDVVRTGDVEPEVNESQWHKPTTEEKEHMNQMLAKYHKKHPKKPSRIIAIGKKIDQAIVNYNRRNMSSGNYNPWGGMFDTGMNRRPIKRYSPRNNYNPWGSMFDTGIRHRPSAKRKTSISKKKYTVIGGKAYPIATTSKKKTKKQKKRKTNLKGGFDIMDNWGFMK